MRGGRAAALLLLTSLPLLACASPPWLLGEPIDGRPSITPGSARLTIHSWHALARSRRETGRIVTELEALLALDEAHRLTDTEEERLVVLLERRAAQFRVRGRAIPASRDLRVVERLDPELAATLAAERAQVERDAGDAWLAIGALGQATEAYQRAAKLGAPDLVFRERAAAGAPPPPTTSLAEMEAAIAALPLRAVPSVALEYVTRGGADRVTLVRGVEAAQQERMPTLTARLQGPLGPALQPKTPVAAAAPVAADAAVAVDAAVAADAGAPDAAVATPAPSPPPAVAARQALPADLDAWVFGDITLSARLLPLVPGHPELLEGPRAIRWVDLLLAEDPTSPDVLELGAMIFGRARRFGGTERLLMELAYHSADRAAGLARGAEVWESLGRPREACAERIRAARWRDDADDPNWRRAIACARRDPGAGDWRAIRRYVLDLAPPARRQALAATLDAP